MSAEAFHHHNCPLCGSSTLDAAIGRFNGRLVCPYCNSNLVVSPHGQFVRDPFARAALISTEQLRRQSGPLARILRDIQSPLRLFLGGLALLAITGLTWTSFVDQTAEWRNHNPASVEQIK